MGDRPTYVIYTDDGTHQLVGSLIDRDFSHLADRLKLVNLDADPYDSQRLEPIRHLQLDAKNAASVRRTLADATHLPWQSRRLLLG